MNLFPSNKLPFLDEINYAYRKFRMKVDTKIWSAIVNELCVNLTYDTLIARPLTILRHEQFLMYRESK